MQIQSIRSAATAAAATTAQAAAKDRSTTATSSATDLAATLATEKVGKSEETNADRDAQGGGEGLGSRPPKSRSNAAESQGRSPSAVDAELAAKLLEPPSQLDLIG